MDAEEEKGTDKKGDKKGTDLWEKRGRFYFLKIDMEIWGHHTN